MKESRLTRAWVFLALPFSMVVSGGLVIGPSDWMGADQAGSEPVRYARIKPADVELRLELVGPPPLPYQAARLRLSVRNVSKSRLGPVGPMDRSAGALVKWPGRESYESLPKSIVLADRDQLGVGRSREHMNRLAPLSLDSGQQTSVSFAVAASWQTRDDGKGFADVPIFEEPGDYWMKCRYSVGTMGEAFIEAVIKITVPAPKDDDKAVLDLVQNDPDLRAAVMRPADAPDPVVFAKLRAIVDRYPDSSYTDYARFALARGYFRGVGISHPSDRVTRAFSADQLEKIITDRYDAKLRKVVSSGFAYLPNTLLLMKAVDPQAKPAALERLHREFPDALEWIEEFASRLASADATREEAEFVLKRRFPEDPDDVKAFVADAWMRFRKQTPVPRKKSDARP